MIVFYILIRIVVTQACPLFKLTKLYLKFIGAPKRYLKLIFKVTYVEDRERIDGWIDR